MSSNKYARKHKAQQEKLIKSNRESPLFEAIFEDSLDFINKFRKQDTDTQVAIVKILHSIVRKDESVPTSGKEKYYAEEARYFLNKIHRMAKCSYDRDIFYPLARDEKRLIRMECSGTINRRKDDELSFLFKYFRKKAKAGKFSLSSYRLQSSPSWKVFHQFESFRSIEGTVKRQLQKSGIHPDALSVMTISDFCEVIFQAHKQSSTDLTANFLPKGECVKNKQNKEIMKYAGAEFERILLNRKVDGKKIDSRVVKSYCDMMRRYGTDDINSLIVTERKYTKRVLEDLAEKENIDISDIKPGTPIPQEFIDYMVDNDKARLLQARDENGKPITARGLPNLQDHHNRAVMLARRGDTIAAVNYPNNHISVDCRIHQQYLHLFDKVLRSGDVEQIATRLNVEDTNMRVMLGFDAEKDAIYCDLEQSKEFKQRQSKDLKCKVNYFEMMQKRMQNEGKIIKKHNINCPRSYIREGYRNLEEIKTADDYNKEAMKQVEKLLKANYIARKKGKNR